MKWDIDSQVYTHKIYHNNIYVYIEQYYINYILCLFRLKPMASLRVDWGKGCLIMAVYLGPLADDGPVNTVVI